MGLLDEAIREHLDLKRRRGADPAEIERAEREALGPVRRDVGEDPDLLGVPTEFEDPASDDPYYTEDAAQAPPAAISEPEYVEQADDYGEHTDAGAVDAQLGVEPPGSQVDAVPEPPAAAAPEPVRAATPDDDLLGPSAPGGRRGDETAEFDVERAFDTDEAAPQEDVLEETPEFLQDTPDHDRLWFEQRPPRDFDFDGWADSSRPTRKLVRIGAIAQMGERLLCKQEVTGSIPVGLHFAESPQIGLFFASSGRQEFEPVYGSKGAWRGHQVDRPDGTTRFV